MADPICRWRNATPETVCEIIEALPKREMSEEKFREVMSKSNFGSDFFHTPYQLACQLALYYIDDNHIYHPRFSENITKEAADKYLHYWFRLYYIPNPYTKKGFDNLSKPQYFEKTLFESLQKRNVSTDFSDLLNKTFKDEIGELDILKNLINRYSDLLEIENNKISIKIKDAENMEINVDRNDRESFFNSFNKKSSEIPYPHNRIIFGAPGTGKSFRLKKESTENSFFSEITRVTFHPDYSYSQFVGTYKPTMIKADNKQEDENTRQIIQVLQNKTSSSQEKYNILYDKFKENNLTLLPFLLGLYTDDAFSTRKKDGSATADDNNAERNHGKAIRSYVNLKSENDGEEISYKYIPGPFLRTLVNALKSNRLNETKNYLLIIEEINRARVSAVFGDMFQLLDRNEYGESEYEIQTSEDMRNFLTEQLGGNKDDYQTIRLPNNFYIWATMNSADQGVFPMDTAFKRRWNFEYIGIDENESGVSAYEIPISRIVNEKKIIKKVNWNKLRQAINKKLISLNVNEDKLLGPYFIGEKDLKSAMQNQEDFINLFKSKVLMYLFEDAAKMKRNFFNCDKYIYSEICKEFDKKGIEVFNFSDDEKGELKELEIAPNPENPGPASE
ncbi:AAA family ATPase [Treponema sp.]|uniref:AAA family ATPase n=1 Tax=Treponema sp. TaxID=166 RepID=UPI003FD80AE4